MNSSKSLDAAPLPQSLFPMPNLIAAILSLDPCNCFLPASSFGGLCLWYDPALQSSNHLNTPSLSTFLSKQQILLKIGTVISPFPRLFSSLFSFHSLFPLHFPGFSLSSFFLSFPPLPFSVLPSCISILSLNIRYKIETQPIFVTQMKINFCFLSCSP